jgi:hypothetical protein
MNANGIWGGDLNRVELHLDGVASVTPSSGLASIRVHSRLKLLGAALNELALAPVK